MLASPSELLSATERAERAESECQRLREIVSTLVDEKMALEMMVRELGRVLWRQ